MRLCVPTFTRYILSIMLNHYLKLLSLATSALVLFICSCSNYDTDINELNSRLDTLEQTVSNLQSLINNGYLVSDYVQTENGWNLTLKNASGAIRTLVVLNGEDGVDGIDGINGSNGIDGQNGADGKDGDSFFASVVVNDSYVTITLTDGTVFNIPLYSSSVIERIKDLKLIPGTWDGTYRPGGVSLIRYWDSEKYVNISMTPEFRIIPSRIASSLKESLPGLSVVAKLRIYDCDSLFVLEPSSVDIEGDTLSIAFTSFPSEMDKSQNSEYSMTVEISDASGNLYVTDYFTLWHESEPAIVYKGEKYEISWSKYYVKDGDYKVAVMVDPLRYVPEGYTPSSDLTNTMAGVYYPVVLDESTSTLVMATSEEDVRNHGYLYQIETALGLPLNKNQKLTEGAQGICPDGWHIPTKSELEAFIDSSNKYVNFPTNLHTGYLIGEFTSFSMTMGGKCVSTYSSLDTFCWSSTPQTNTGTSSVYGLSNAYNEDWQNCRQGYISAVQRCFAAPVRCVKSYR